ncbi:hypothetical protein N0V88_004556 [Collariella sp. IMI 366227]|nr:hypothetical protein N0V88_004556 [Collariella sp. IMI 366227]
MDPFEASKPDRFQQSLSSAWASFLSAQHCAKEVAALRRSFEEHTRRTDLSVAALQRETSQRHDLLATVVAESKSIIGQHAAELKETASFRTNFSLLQQDVKRDKEDASKTLTGLSGEVAAQRQSLEGLRSVTVQEISSIQEQWRSVLETMNSLQEELREIKAGRLASEQKLIELERQINTTNQNRQELSEEMVLLLSEIESRREDLMDMLDRQNSKITPEVSSQTRRPKALITSQAPVFPGGIISQGHLAPRHPTTQLTAETTHSPTTSNQNPPSPPIPTQPRLPLMPTHNTNHTQDIRTLYLLFRNRYKTTPPKSDTAFIWEFLNSIQDPAMAKHVQESLANILPDYVTLSRDKRRRNPGKFVNLSRGLTWRRFREALVRVPGPPQLVGV